MSVEAQGTRGAAGQCTSCGRTAPPAKRLFEARAPQVELLICDECVLECATLIADVPTRIPGAARSCPFCGKTEQQVAVIVAVGSTRICDECVDAYRTELP